MIRMMGALRMRRGKGLARFILWRVVDMRVSLGEIRERGREWRSSVMGLSLKASG